MIRTARLLLRPWCDEHRAAFASMNADPEVMADQGGAIGRAESDAKLDGYMAAYERYGISRWAVEDHAGVFLGSAGVLPHLRADHVLGPHHEVGWRFVRSAWGHGYATESAAAALDHAFRVTGVNEVLSFTTAENLKSRAVMERLSLLRAPARDFVVVGRRRLVWVATWGDRQAGW